MSFSSSLLVLALDAVVVDGFDATGLEDSAGVANAGNEGFDVAGAVAGVEEPNENEGFVAVGAAAGVEPKEKPPNGFDGVVVRDTEAKAPLPAVPGVDDWLAFENLHFAKKKKRSNWVRNHVCVEDFIQTFPREENYSPKQITFALFSYSLSSRSNNASLLQNVVRCLLKRTFWSIRRALN